MFKTAAEFQKLIYDETGIKTSVKKLTGSMKGYLMISPMFQNGQYPEIPFELTQRLTAEFPGEEPNPNFYFITNFSIYGIEQEVMRYRKENKPKNKDGVSSHWGSKNSQLRLDKATRRYAKRLKKGNSARYY